MQGGARPPSPAGAVKGGGKQLTPERQWIPDGLGAHNTHTNTQATNSVQTTMNRTKHSEQAEPTLLRAAPLLGGVNTQHMQAAKGWGKGPKGMGKPGTPRSQWGEVWNSKGKGHLGKGHAWGDRWGQRRTAGHQALTVAPAVCLGKGTFPWGGRGRGWGQRVQQVPYCSNPSGRPHGGKDQPCWATKGEGQREGSPEL